MQVSNIPCITEVFLPMIPSQTDKGGSLSGLCGTCLYFLVSSPSNHLSCRTTPE
ncbi:hypothetical protein J1N35_027770 [Gossypium stocksii]|uniref:Uncharacterized protein n=1 Tax=Gossypium stocksii TaxID=47602 RepID=A0A9D3VAR3_9ROSI|nr:hypothetical protein J1N35_027770 [Gossypium stocksii]